MEKIRRAGTQNRQIAEKNNWWGPAGQTGPCGPDTEMFYWTGDADKIPESFNDDNDSWWKSGMLYLCNTTKARMANIIH